MRNAPQQELAALERLMRQQSHRSIELDDADEAWWITELETNIEKGAVPVPNNIAELIQQIERLDLSQWRKH